MELEPGLVGCTLLGMGFVCYVLEPRVFGVEPGWKEKGAVNQGVGSNSSVYLYSCYKPMHNVLFSSKNVN